MATKETTIDSPCNIYDMESNCVEWSTKTCANEEIPCINRGGSYKYDFDFASTRNNSILESSYEDYSFCPILYL